MVRSSLTRMAVVSCVVVLAASAVVEAQERGRGRGRGGFGIGGGFGRGDNVVALLGNPQVREELKLTEEQQAKITEATSPLRELFGGLRDLSREERAAKMAEIQEKSQEAEEKALAVLDPDQKKRLKEMRIQLQGAEALRDEEVVKALEINEEQQAILKTIFEAGEEKRRELFASAREGNGDRGEMFRKMNELREETEKDAMAVLNETQQAKLKELKGKPFELRRGGFGRGGDRRRDDGEGRSRPESDTN